MLSPALVRSYLIPSSLMTSRSKCCCFRTVDVKHGLRFETVLSTCVNNLRVLRG